MRPECCDEDGKEIRRLDVIDGKLIFHNHPFEKSEQAVVFDDLGFRDWTFGDICAYVLRSSFRLWTGR